MAKNIPAIALALVLTLALVPSAAAAPADDAGMITLPPLAPGEHTLYLSGRFCDRPDDAAAAGYRLRIRGKHASADGDSDSDDSDGDSDRPSNVEIIRSLYDAFAAGDLDTILAIIHEDVIWVESEGIPYGGTFVGRDAVFEGVFAKIAAEWDGFTAVADEFFAADGNRVIVLQRDGGTFKATGKSMEAPAASIWTLDHDGRVIHFLQYIDTLEVVSATIP